ncbi:MAG: DNA adenine methylase [Devosiaceae bacterium]|nr:DNA adenine methylase [Devosiaceae bacterium]
MVLNLAIKERKEIKPEVNSCKTNNFVKSPLNYIGGKYKILDQIIPLFPNEINCFVDLFAGGCNVGINVDAQEIIFNDNLIYLVDLYRTLQNKELLSILKHIHTQINKFDLSKENEAGYKRFRLHYNSTQNPLDLLVLVAYSFNHQIRFNNSHEFNNPFGRNRSSYNQNTERNLISFINAVKSKNVEFQSLSFDAFNFNSLGKSDFIYCDPPYLIATGTYNDGKRGFKGWSKNEEFKLLEMLDSLNSKGIMFALSNVLEHKGKSNDILKSWLNKNKQYATNYIHKNYSNSNYQTIDRNKSSSTEVLITNYTPPQINNKNLQLVFDYKK